MNKASNTLKYKEYTGSIEYSPEDKCFFGKILFIDVLESIKKIKKEVYTPTRFIRMLYQYNNNAVEVVKTLVAKDSTIGIEKLYEKGKLDLSIEALVVKPEYKELFPIEIVDICSRKLKKLGYKAV